MENNITHQNAITLADHHDDLDVLRHAFALPPVTYIDISHQARLTQMMARWPLLAELAHFPSTESQHNEQQG